MKKKKIIIGAIIVIILAASIKPVYMYYEYKQEERRLSQPAYFTEDMLSKAEYNTMATKYHVDETPYWWETLNKEDWPDYSYYTMEATEDTEMAVAVLNHYLFDEHLEGDEAGWEKAKEYGFTSDNRITVEWVMEHPKDAVEIMNSMWNNGDLFQYYRRVKAVYEEITGASIQESTEQLEEAAEQE